MLIDSRQNWLPECAKNTPKRRLMYYSLDFDNIYGNLLEIGKGSCPVSQVQLDTKEINPQKVDSPAKDGFSTDIPL